MAFLTTGFLSLLGLFAVSSIVFTCTLVELTLSLRDPHSGGLLLFQSRVRNDHTYVGSDYPMRLPDFEPRHVRMAVEESVRFSIYDAEAPVEWSSMSPPGEGSVRLGPENRAFLLSMFHELHCLRTFQQFLRHPEWSIDVGHAQHCLNYLRQCSLCQADRTLEVGDFAARNFSSDRVGATHTCRDWSMVYDKATYDWSGWTEGIRDTSVS